MSYLNAKAGEAMLQCAKATDGEKHCKASGPDSDNVGATGPKDYFKTVFDFVNADPHRKSEGSDASGYHRQPLFWTSYRLGAQPSCRTTR